MKAISLTQPWASLVACGAKRVETRSWRSNYRGLIVIHAAKKFPLDCRLWAEEEPLVLERLRELAPELEITTLPRGAIVAVARLSNILPTTDARVETFLKSRRGEREFGDYSEGRYAWKFDDVRPLKTPIAAKGALSLWDVTGDLLAAVQEQLR
jgi:hypothetical protein